MDVVYLDNNATTKPAPEVVAEMLPYLNELYGNPSSVHRFGQRARKAIDEARGRIATLIGCAESELLFTGGGMGMVKSAGAGRLAGPGGRSSVFATDPRRFACRGRCEPP